MKYYAPHGVARECLASGAPLPEGDFFDLSEKAAKDPHNARLITEGKILPASEAAEKTAKTVKKEVEA